MREIPKKNYLLLIILFVVTAGIVFFARDIYNSRTTKQYTSVMNSFLTEIKLDDLNGYTLENSQVVIFISDKSTSSFEELEIEYKKIITEHNLQPLFVYLDVNNTSNLDLFNQKYDVQLKLEELPILVVIMDGKVTDTYLSSNFNEVDVIEFLEKNKNIENN